MTERLGIFGGSFSPPHTGHLYAARTFVREMKLDRLLIIPACISPGKTVTDPVPAEMRLAMCRLAFAGLPEAEVSDTEIRRGGVSYTADTLRELTRPGREIFVLCGTDTAMSLDRWHTPGVLFELATFVCIRRHHDPAFEEAFARQNEAYRASYGHTVRLIDAPAHPASSTEVRAALARGEEPKEVCPAVLAYIRENGLYHT